MVDFTEEQRAKVKAVLSDLQYYSTEESEEERDERKPKRLRRKIPWERSELRRVKAQLDKAFLKNCTATQRRLLLDVDRGETLSTRPMPLNAPKWAAKDRTGNSTDQSQ